MNIKNLHWLWLAFAILILDQLTKYLISVNLQLGESIPVLPILDIVLAHNQGASFGMLNNAGGWQQWLFGILAIVVCIGILVWMMKLPSNKKWTLTALALVFAGAIGNLFDRIYHGYVVDFIYFHLQDLYWPAFNVADSAIVIGAIMLLLEAFLQGKKK